MKRTEHTYSSQFEATLELDAKVTEWELDKLCHPNAHHNRHVCLCKMGQSDYRVIVEEDEETVETCDCGVEDGYVVGGVQ